MFVRSAHLMVHRSFQMILIPATPIGEFCSNKIDNSKPKSDILQFYSISAISIFVVVLPDRKLGAGKLTQPAATARVKRTDWRNWIWLTEPKL